MLNRQFGEDEHGFVLQTRGWREVEKTCGAGLAVIAARLAPLVNLIEAGPAARAAFPGGVNGIIAAGHFGSAMLDDVRAPILQGLIDGGRTPTEAGALMKVNFDLALANGEPVMLRFGQLAFDVLSHALIGLLDEPLGET
jgi:hypothetical protein